VSSRLVTPCLVVVMPESFMCFGLRCNTRRPHQDSAMIHSVLVVRVCLQKLASRMCLILRLNLTGDLKLSSAQFLGYKAVYGSCQWSLVTKLCHGSSQPQCRDCWAQQVMFLNGRPCFSQADERHLVGPWSNFGLLALAAPASPLRFDTFCVFVPRCCTRALRSCAG
jgi:hypothetical protein